MECNAEATGPSDMAWGYNCATTLGAQLWLPTSRTVQGLRAAGLRAAARLRTYPLWLWLPPSLGCLFLALDTAKGRKRLEWEVEAAFRDTRAHVWTGRDLYPCHAHYGSSEGLVPWAGLTPFRKAGPTSEAPCLRASPSPVLPLP